METPDRRANSTAPKSDKTDLEVFLRVTGPELFRKHAANILMIVLLLIAATMFLYTRSRNKAAEQQATNQNTAIAYDFAQHARELFQLPVFSDAAAKERQQKVRDVLNAVELVLTSDAAPAQKAAAQLAKADVLWHLANAPEQSLATSQPTAGFTAKAPAAYLDDAEQAYTDLLSRYTDQKEYAANALISLAAVAETRGKFADARKWYDRVIDDKTLRPVYHEVAAARKRLLDDLESPFTLAPPTTQPTTQATTQPGAALLNEVSTPSLPLLTDEGPATLPATIPADR